MDVDVLALNVGSLGQRLDAGALDRSAVAEVVSFVHGCGRQLLVWCPEREPARMLMEAGADALVVNDVPAALAALRTTP
jgi:glycerophosphoryl diester phosphodiesterase